MRFEGAVIKEQGVTFAIVIVKKHVLDNRSDTGAAVSSFQQVFPGMPIVLMAQDSIGTPTYYGRPDIVRFMATVPLHAVPWQEFSIG